MKAKLLWIEGRRADSPSFVPALRKKGLLIETVSTGSAALARLPEFDPDIMVLNSASMRSSGVRICRSLLNNADGVPILAILGSDHTIPEGMCADVILKLPFTARKLLNRIKPLLPGDDKNVLQAGPIQLDLKLKRVRCQGREASLTPRLTDLLKEFMQHPDEVLERGRLFRDIWKTEYTGDTRTLDVHISWLRQAIEEKPRKPKFIKTIRGVGYRLDV